MRIEPRIVVPLLLSLIVAGGFAWILSAGALPVVPEKSYFRQVQWGAVGAYAVLWALVLVLRGARWVLLLAPVRRIPVRTAISFGLIASGAIVLLPWRMGELVRPALVRRGGYVSGRAAAGTIGAERIIDGLFLSMLLFLALQIARPVEPLPDHIGDLPVPAAVVPHAAQGALLVFASAFVVMGVFYWRRELARRVTHRVLGLFSERVADFFANTVERIASGFGFLPRMRYTVPFLAMTALYWALAALGMWLLAGAVGLGSLGFGQATVVLGVLALGILVPNAPGIFGSFQISVYAGLALYLPPDELVQAGAVYVFLLYVVQIGVTMLCAVTALSLERISPSVIVHPQA